MADKLQPQLQKRATNPFVKSWSGALRLVGVQPDGYNPDIFPAFSATYTASNSELALALTKGARADYDILKYYAIGPNGNKIQATADVNGEAQLDLSGLSTDFVPGGVYVVSIGVIFRPTRGASLNDDRRVLDYNFQVSPARFRATLRSILWIVSIRTTEALRLTSLPFTRLVPTKWLYLSPRLLWLA